MRLPKEKSSCAHFADHKAKRRKSNSALTAVFCSKAQKLRLRQPRSDSDGLYSAFFFFLFYNDGAAFSVAVIPTLRVSVCVCVCVLDSFYSLPFQVAISALFFFSPLHRCTHFSSFLKNKLKEPNNEIGSCNVVAVRCPSPNK